MMDTKNLLIILTPTALLSLFPEHLTVTRKCPSSPRFLVGQLECVGVSDLEYKGAGGGWGAAAGDPACPSSYRPCHTDSAVMEEPSPALDELKHTASKTLFSLQDKHLLKTSLF